MFHKPRHYPHSALAPAGVLAQQQPLARPPRQHGGALAVAIFIIVVMSILGVAMVRILGDLGRSTVSDVYGARAYAAARSGAEVFLTQLFPLNSAVNASLCPERVSNLPATEVFTASYNEEGLANCNSSVRCDRFELQSPFNGTHFRIITEGSCDAGSMVYSKQVILEAADGIF